MADRVNLQWVVCNGEDRHVSEFASLAPGKRPEVVCPECEQELVLKLGTVKAWHAAHKPGADCALSNGESALHHNAKMALAAKLRGTRVLVTEQYCAHHTNTPWGMVPCKRINTQTLAVGYDDVQVERRVHERRPDVTLLQSGKVLAGLEVLVTHEVSPQKAQDLAKYNLRWAEVRAETILGTDEVAEWAPPAPLRATQVDDDRNWLCASCKDRIAEREAEAAKLATTSTFNPTTEGPEANVEKLRKRFTSEARAWHRESTTNGVRPVRLRLFDAYGPHGQLSRDGLVICEVFRDGQRVGAFLSQLSNTTVLMKVAEASLPRGFRDLDRRATQHLSDLGNSNQAVVPSQAWIRPMEWLDRREVYDQWTYDGKDHRWMPEVPADSSWRPPWCSSPVDGLDFLRFLFVRYLAGLPLRRTWSRKNKRWFNGDLNRQTTWRFLP